jgi:hypothetical protein
LSQQSVNTTQDGHENNSNDHKDKTCIPLPQHIFETEIADDRHSQYSRDNSLSRDIEFTLIRSSADRNVIETKNRLSSAAHDAFHGPPKRYINKIKNGQEYYDLNIDMELQKDDRIFLEQPKQNNVEIQFSFDPFTNEKRSQKEKSKCPDTHLPLSSNGESENKSPPCGYLLRGNKRIYFSMSILDEAENKNGQDISPSTTILAQHKQTEKDILEENLQPQIGNPILKDEFMPNDESASYDETDYLTQKEYDEYMKSLADQLKTVNSELDTAFDDVKSEFSKPSYLDSYFGLQENEQVINTHENIFFRTNGS